MQPSNRLLYVASAPGTNTLDEYQDWYENEHVANRLPFQALHTADRWYSVDAAEEHWLATYDVESSLFEDPAYTALRSNRSERETAVIENLSLFSRETFSAVSNFTKSERHCENPEYLLSVKIDASADNIDSVIDWYEEEHIPMLLSLPSWHGVRLFLKDDPDSSVKELLALHSLIDLAGFESPRYAQAISTSRRDSVMAVANKKARILYRHYRSYK